MAVIEPSRRPGKSVVQMAYELDAKEKRKAKREGKTEQEPAEPAKGAAKKGKRK